jgi:hypothetical protein
MKIGLTLKILTTELQIPMIYTMAGKCLLLLLKLVTVIIIHEFYYLSFSPDTLKFYLCYIIPIIINETVIAVKFTVPVVLFVPCTYTLPSTQWVTDDSTMQPQINFCALYSVHHPVQYNTCQYFECLSVQHNWSSTEPK